MKVAAVVLAAGASTRLGEPKQTVSVAGEPLLDRAVRAAREAGLDPILVVLGAHADRIRAACSLSGATVVLNEEWPEGMASSVRAGVAAVPSEADGLVLMTCDQPAATAEHLSRLCLAADGDAVHAVASSYRGKLGVPAFFPASRREELMQLRGDAGARELLGAAQAVALAGGELDVDTAESLAEAQRRFG